MFKTLLASALLLFTLQVNAETKIPPFQGDILDETHTFNASELQDLRNKIQKLRVDRGVWMAVYFASDLKETTIEDLASKTFHDWKLGEKDKNNGLLFIAVPKAHKMRLEVGYGLEGTLTDAWTKRLQMQILVPAFQVRKYYAGLSDTLIEIDRRFQNPGENPEPKRHVQKQRLPNFVVLILLAVFFGFNIFFAILRRRSGGYGGYSSGEFPGGGYSSRGGDGGFGDGGGSSSGGGDSGGGGSSSDW